MIRIALVSYFNTRPFIDGLHHWFGEDEMEIHEVPPAQCAAELREGNCDFALLPVGSLVDFTGLTLLKDHCIGADGHVDSVFVFSHVPIEEVEALVLDPHSRTSNGLAAVLLKEHWNKDVKMVKPQGERFSQVEGKTCGVAIGDKAYAMRSQFPYTYDLAEAWKRFTGLPFVFAVWAFREGTLAGPEIERLRTALEWGRKNRKQSAAKWGVDYGYTPEEAENYLLRSISFEFDSAKHEAMKKFFGLLKHVLVDLEQAC
jgi:chorismate dehydratase